jgi:hypothetical protein
MAWMDAINDIINRYSGAAGGTATASADAHEDFLNVAKTAPSQVTTDALAHAFRSDQTPSFPEMVSNLYQGSNPEQRAGLLNELIGSVGPAVLAGIPGLGALASSIGAGQPVTPQQAAQISGEQVQRAAETAQRTNPSIVDRVSSFYAAHPNVVKALGTVAITMMLKHISRRGAGF